MIDPATDRNLFTVRSIELSCEKCKEDGKAHECVHMLHLVPRWHSEERHRKLKVIMQVWDIYSISIIYYNLLSCSVWFLAGMVLGTRKETFGNRGFSL